MAAAQVTTDHDKIQRWVEARGGRPARVKRTGRGADPGILRIDYPGFAGEGTLEPISWSKWFDAFDKDKLAFLFDDKANSRFSKLVARAKAATPRRATAAKRTTAKRTTAKRGTSKRKAATGEVTSIGAEESRMRKTPRPMAARIGKRATAAKKRAAPKKRTAPKRAGAKRVGAKRAGVKRTGAKRTGAKRTGAKRGAAEKRA